MLRQGDRAVEGQLEGVEGELEGGVLFFISFQKGKLVCTLSADGRTWVESRRVSINREVTIHNLVPEYVAGAKIRNTGGGIGFGQKEHLLSLTGLYPF